VEKDHVLQDILRPGLDAVFVGSAVAGRSAAVGHYYANPRNRFWVRLHEAGLTAKVRSPDDDATLLTLGIGLTDLNKVHVRNNDQGLTFDVAGFDRRISLAPPAWVVFNGVGVARAYAEFHRHPRPGYGHQDWAVGPSRVFVVPNSSGQNGSGRRLGGNTVSGWWSQAAVTVRGA
jgi:TDG/mug DNA glycosylase family protein